MPEFVNFILKENGTYLNSILFPGVDDKVTSHNPIFAFVLHTDSSDAWVSKGMNYQVTICYDLKFLDVHPDSREYVELTSLFQNIMQCKVNFLAFSPFERAIGLYTKLFEIIIHQPNKQNGEFCATFRRETSSMTDMHLHLALERYKHPVDHALWRCEAENSWCDFFKGLDRLYWYHDYVMFLVDSVKRDGYSMSNVDAALLEIRQAETTNQTCNELTITRTKQSLLELLKKAYKYTLK